MTETVYRFVPSNIPGQWAVFHRRSGTRIPGLVKVKPNAPGDAKRFCYERPVAGKIGNTKVQLVSLTAGTVAELSAKLEQYFGGNP